MAYEAMGRRSMSLQNLAFVIMFLFVGSTLTFSLLPALCGLVGPGGAWWETTFAASRSHEAYGHRGPVSYDYPEAPIFNTHFGRNR